MSSVRRGGRPSRTQRAAYASRVKRTTALLLSLLLACGDGATATTATTGLASSSGSTDAASSSSGDLPTTGGGSSSTTGGPVPLTVAESTGEGSTTGGEVACEVGALRPIPWAATGVERVLPAGGAWEPLWAAQVPFCGQIGGGLVLDVVAELGAMSIGGALLDLRLVVGGAPVVTREGVGPSPTSGFVVGPVLDYSRALVWSVAHFPAAVGPLDLELQAKSSANLRVRDLRVVVLVP